ncbi:hypothetical protein RM96_18920 [Cupriavidus sp. IDO]|nr:hypothetical protein RM96_18920 [Cupriavidus sp. IDO]
MQMVSASRWVNDDGRPMERFGATFFVAVFVGFFWLGCFAVLIFVTDSVKGYAVLHDHTERRLMAQCTMWWVRRFSMLPQGVRACRACSAQDALTVYRLNHRMANCRPRDGHG